MPSPQKARCASKEFRNQPDSALLKNYQVSFSPSVRPSGNCRASFQTALQSLRPPSPRTSIVALRPRPRPLPPMRITPRMLGKAFGCKREGEAAGRAEDFRTKMTHEDLLGPRVQPEAGGRGARRKRCATAAATSNACARSPSNRSSPFSAKFDGETGRPRTQKRNKTTAANAALQTLLRSRLEHRASSLDRLKKLSMTKGRARPPAEPKISEQR